MISKQNALNQYSKMIWKFANKYQYLYLPSTSLEDIYNIGVLGLMKAVRDFDPDNEKKAQFGTYACIKIQGEIRYKARLEARYPAYPIGLEDHHLVSPSEQKTDYSDLYSVLNGMGERPRKIVELTYGLNNQKVMKQGEIAELMGCSRTTVVNNLTKFRKKVRDEHPELARLY